MPSLKEVKRRINSIRSTQKITSAMQMVSSAKLHMAQTALGNMLPYEEQLYYIFASFFEQEMQLDAQGYPSNLKPLMQSPFVKDREVKQVALVVMASDSGLCGAYNSNMAKMLQKTLADYQDLPRENITLYPVGKKMVQAAEKTGCRMSRQFEGLISNLHYESCSTLSRRLGIEYLRGRVDKVELLFYHFKNMAVQEIERSVFLPFPLYEITLDNPSYGRELHGKQGVIIPSRQRMADSGQRPISEYIIEPDRQQLMDLLLPKVMRFRVFRAVLDANASEHAARTMAMKVATENAEDLISELTVLYNKSRQQAITNELLDIAGGSEN